MKTIGIFYGSTSGNTQAAAELIASKLGVTAGDLYDVGRASGADLQKYDVLLFGSSTWGLGDLQDDWEGFIAKLGDLSGRQVAVFGTGDSVSYSDSFCSAIGTIARAAEKAGARLAGTGVPAADYSFDDSEAFEGGSFLGLPLDYDNEDNKSDQRISQWIDRLRTECGL